MRLLVALVATAVWGQTSTNVAVPRTWDVERLTSYELPLAVRSVTPVHISPQRYYAIPAETIYRTYPRHSRGKTDEEYFAWLRQQEPEVISAEPSRILTKEEWVRIGKAVFEWPATITPAERPIGATTRLVIREKGKIEFGNAACYGCHARYLPDGTVIPGAQVNIQLVWAARQSNPQAPAATTRLRQTNEWATPWFTPDPNAVPDDMPAATFTQLFVRSPNQAPRGGTSPFAPAKVPDLIGIADGSIWTILVWANIAILGT